jgi:hypothetical protein
MAHFLFFDARRFCFGLTNHKVPACTGATAHPQHGHRRTTYCTSGSARLPGTCTPQRQAKRPDTTALGPRSRLPFLPSIRLASCRHSTRVSVCWSREGTCPVTVVSSAGRCRTILDPQDLPAISSRVPINRSRKAGRPESLCSPGAEPNLCGARNQ